MIWIFLILSLSLDLLISFDHHWQNKTFLLEYQSLADSISIALKLTSRICAIIGRQKSLWQRNSSCSWMTQDFGHPRCPFDNWSILYDWPQAWASLNIGHKWSAASRTRLKVLLHLQSFRRFCGAILWCNKIARFIASVTALTSNGLRKRFVAGNIAESRIGFNFSQRQPQRFACITNQETWFGHVGNDHGNSKGRRK